MICCIKDRPRKAESQNPTPRMKQSVRRFIRHSGAIVGHGEKRPITKPQGVVRFDHAN
jgi:hypothetical protein